MKVAYLLSVFPKLSESFILNEITEQLKDGSEILVFSLNTPHDTVLHDEVNELNVFNKTHYFCFRNILHINIIIFFLNVLRCFFYEVRDSRMPKNILKIAYFATIMEKENINLIHTHFATMGVYAKELSCVLNVPYTLTAHAYDIYIEPDIDRLRDFMDNADSVVTISNYNKEYLENQIGIKNNVEVIRCGISSMKFNPSTTTNDYSEIDVLTVSRLVEKKGIEYLIRSIPIIVEKIPNCKFTIVGSGYLKDSLNQLVEDLGINAYVDFKGDISDSELIDCYNAADIFVLPCIVAENGDRDGIPVTMMEVMAMEIPIVSTDISGIPELVENDVSGILVPQKDVEALSKAIIKLCNDEDLRIKMGKAGRNIVLEKFNIKNEAKKVNQLFQSITNLATDN